jgi:hypothetical protein
MPSRVSAIVYPWRCKKKECFAMLGLRNILGFMVCSLLSGAVSASPIILDPIQIHGSGYWEWDYGLGLFESFTYSGTSADGLHLISATVDSGIPDPVLFSLVNITTWGGIGGLCHYDGLLVLDGISSGPICNSPFPDAFATGQDIANIYEAGSFPNGLVFSVPLVGAMQVTGDTEEYFGSRLVRFRETFLITPDPAPEPAYVGIVGMALAVFLSRRSRPRGLPL